MPATCSPWPGGLGGDPGQVTNPTFTLVHEYPAAAARFGLVAV